MPNDDKIITIEILILAKIFFFNKMLINCVEVTFKIQKKLPQISMNK
jgi:hypothetical protein